MPVWLQTPKDDSVNVGNKMRETVEVSQKGREDMEHVGEALENIRTSIQNLEAAVNKVGTASGEIVEIVQLIGNIAAGDQPPVLKRFH